ncbi:MAG: hypothetical protein AB1414_20165 [bacterium]
MKYSCPRAYTDDCNQSKCSFYGDDTKCKDGQLDIEIADESDKVISCPRAYKKDCEKDRCSLYGTKKCVDGKVKIKFLNL